MADYNRYIGIPYVHHGRDESGLDCFGLVRLVLKNEFGKNLQDWRDEEITDRFKKTDEPAEGCIGLFKFIGVPAHVGVYIGGGRVLHVTPDETAVAEKLDSRRLQGRLLGWYTVE